MLLVAFMGCTQPFGNNRLSVQFSSKQLKLHAENGKGFGKSTKSMKNVCEEDSSKPFISDAKDTFSEETDKTQSIVQTINAEQAIRESKYMRKVKALKIDSIKQKLAALKEEEELLNGDPSVGAVPELVANRMIRRIVTFFGIPVFGGIGIFVAAVISSKYYDTTIPPGVIAYATQVPFVLGLLGITYAILSSSWDEVRVLEF